MTRATRSANIFSEISGGRGGGSGRIGDGSERALPIIVSAASHLPVPSYLTASAQDQDVDMEGNNSNEPERDPLFASMRSSTIRTRNGLLSLVLPTCFNLKNKSQWAELEPGNLQASYTGLGKGAEIDSATVKGNAPIPPACGIYYYEVKVISKGRDGYIGIGFTTSTSSQQRLPGIEENSWGYHASDGKKYNSSNSGVVYGPTFSTGDIIGCVINFSDLSISFTRNGIMLGVAWKGLRVLEESPVFPIVGLRTPGEIVHANFGLEPFKFDITQFYRDEKLKLWRSIQAHTLAKESIPTSSAMNNLIVGYLVQEGYHETALTLYNSCIKKADELDETGRTFVDFPGLIVEGKILEAETLISQLYPTFINKYPILHAQLECLRFVEIIRSVSKSATRHLEVDQSAMDMDQVDGPTILDAIKLSQDLKNGEFSHMKLVSDAIDEIISLICYPNPHDSPLSYILNPRIRNHISELVNCTLLELQGYKAASPLEQLYRQLLAVDELMAEKTSGSQTLLNLAAFVRVD